MRLLAPAWAAMRSTRAPARPWAENSCLAASRMRSRIPSGSGCHLRVCFPFANPVVRWVLIGQRVTRERAFENDLVPSSFVGWAKAHLRRAHVFSPNRQDVGTLRFAHPT